jgi:hypothetical protein
MQLQRAIHPTPATTVLWRRRQRKRHLCRDRRATVSIAPSATTAMNTPPTPTMLVIPCKPIPPPRTVSIPLAHTPTTTPTSRGRPIPLAHTPTTTARGSPIPLTHTPTTPTPRGGPIPLTPRRSPIHATPTRMRVLLMLLLLLLMMLRPITRIPITGSIIKSRRPRNLPRRRKSILNRPLHGMPAPAAGAPEGPATASSVARGGTRPRPVRARHDRGEGGCGLAVGSLLLEAVAACGGGRGGGGGLDVVCPGGVGDG